MRVADLVICCQAQQNFGHFLHNHLVLTDAVVRPRSADFPNETRFATNSRKRLFVCLFLLRLRRERAEPWTTCSTWTGPTTAFQCRRRTSSTTSATPALCTRPPAATNRRRRGEPLFLRRKKNNAIPSTRLGRSVDLVRSFPLCDRKVSRFPLN